MKKNINKQLIYSCLQKALRKGLTSIAQTNARQLFAFDPKYLIQKLTTFIFQDVGIANMPLIISFLGTTKNHPKIDNITLLIDIICDSTKDRTAHELSLTLPFYNNPSILEENNEEIYNDKSQPLIRRLSSGWFFLSSAKKTTPNYPILIQDKNKISPEINEIFSFINEQPINPSIIAIPLLDEVYKKESGTIVGNYTTGDFVETTYIPDLISPQFTKDTFDDQTDEGKRAISLFYNQDLKINNYLKSICPNKEQNIISLGNLLFRTTGHNINKRLIYPTAVSTLKTTEQTTFKKTTSNSNANFYEALSFFKEDINSLYEILNEEINKPNPEHFPF